MFNDKQMTESFKKVKKALDKLPGTIQQKVVVGATRKATSVIAKEAKSNVPERTGLLKKSIGVAKAKKKDTPHNHVKFFVVPKSKILFSKSFDASKVKTSMPLEHGSKVKLKVQAHAYYAHMIEFGTKNMVAQPYLRPAMESKAGEAVKAFQEYASKRVDKEIKKLGR